MEKNKFAGQLHRDLKVPEGQNIPYSKLSEAARKEGDEGRAARLAITLRSLSKKK